MNINYNALPVCTTEPDFAFARDGQTRKQADLMDIANGLRAMVTGRLPKAKPACPTVVTKQLPRATRAAMLHQETERHAQRLARKGMGHWAPALAEAELGWFNHQELKNKVEGNGQRSHYGFDDTLTTDSRWMDQLAYAELVEWLKLEAELTDKELEALQLRANGQPQKNGKVETLRRAQAKAQTALCQFA